MALLVLVAAWRAGRRARPWMCRAAAGRGQEALAFGLALLGMAVLGFGLAGLSRTPVLGALLVLAAAGGAGSWGRAVPRLIPPDGIDRALAAAVAVFLAPALLFALAPEGGWDALSYHLAVPRLWLAAGRMRPIPHVLQSYFPFLGETWFQLAMALGGGDDAAKLLNWCFLPLTVHALVRAPARPREGLLAGVLFAAVPATCALAGECYTDLEGAWLALLAAGLLARRSTGSRVTGAALAGAALACRPGTAPVAAAFAAWGLARAARGDRRTGGVVLLALGAPLLPWLLRNWAWTGNPCYPFLARFIADDGWNPYHRAAEVAYLSATPAGGSRLLAFLRFPWTYATEAKAIGLRLSPLLPALLPAALFLRGRRDLVAPAALAAASAALWLAAGGGEGRYLEPFAALAALPAAAGALALAARGRGAALLLGAGLTAGLVAQLAHGLTFVSETYAPWRVAVGAEPRGLYLDRGLPPNFEFMPFARRAEAELPAGARILAFTDVTAYYLGREVVCDILTTEVPAAHRLFLRDPDPARYAKRLRQLGIGWLYVNPGQIGAAARAGRLRYAAGVPAAWTRFWRRYPALALEVGSLKLFRLRSERAAASGPPLALADLPGVEDATALEQLDARRRGDLAAAEAAVRRLAGAFPDLADARVQLAEVLVVRGRPEAAGRELALARKLGADSGGFWLLRSHLDALEGRRADAWRSATRAAARSPTPLFLAAAAARAAAAGEGAAAARARGEALRLSPWDPEIRRILKDAGL